MPFCPYYRAAAIRADYSAHFLRATLQGFRPLSFAQFADGFARRFYLVGRVGRITSE
jgi:hypothetical protein